MDVVYAIYDDRYLVSLYRSLDRAKDELLDYAKRRFYQEYGKSNEANLVIRENGERILIIDDEDDIVFEQYYVYGIRVLD